MKLTLALMLCSLMVGCSQVGHLRITHPCETPRGVAATVSVEVAEQAVLEILDHAGVKIYDVTGTAADKWYFARHNDKEIRVQLLDCNPQTRVTVFETVGDPTDFNRKPLAADVLTDAISRALKQREFF